MLILLGSTLERRPCSPCCHATSPVGLIGLPSWPTVTVPDRSGLRGVIDRQLEPRYGPLIGQAPPSRADNAPLAIAYRAAGRPNQAAHGAEAALTNR